MIDVHFQGDAYRKAANGGAEEGADTGFTGFCAFGSPQCEKSRRERGSRDGEEIGSRFLGSGFQHGGGNASERDQRRKADLDRVDGACPSISKAEVLPTLPI